MSVDDILAEIPGLFRGPGGAVAVVKDGELLGTKVWGFADIHKRIPMTTDTIFPICSITKHIVCGLVTDLKQHPTEAMKATGVDPVKLFDDAFTSLVQPSLLDGTGLTFDDLCNNCSGVPDYWALTVLWGATPEQKWSIKDHGPQMLQRVKKLHFEPRTSYSYSNTNYFIVGRCIEKVTGQSLEELLAQRIFAPANMKTARLCPDAFTHPGPCVPYEGTEQDGYYPGINRIEWAGDAGGIASLDDMINYEKFLDSTRDKPDSWYQKNMPAHKFTDGTTARYGQGLSHFWYGDEEGIGHGGALRGYRMFRVYCQNARLSVVTLLNTEHLDPTAPCRRIAEKLLQVPVKPASTIEAAPEWAGFYLDAVTQLVIEVTLEKKIQVNVRYTRSAEDLITTTDAYTASNKNMDAKLEGDVLYVNVPAENRRIEAKRMPKANVSGNDAELAGTFRCDEIDSTFHCDGTGTLLYGSFDGFLGQGPVHLIRSMAKDAWALTCPRGMDSSPPGDWTILANRDESGKVTSLTIGCWLTRRHVYTRVN